MPVLIVVDIASHLIAGLVVFVGSLLGAAFQNNTAQENRSSAASRSTQPNNNAQRTASATHGVFQTASIPPLRLPSEVGERAIDNLSPPISGRSC